MPHRRRAKFTPEEITDRLFLPMLLEATRVLEDKLVHDVRDVDSALIFGIGFPPFKGGLFFWADQVGTTKNRRKTQAYESLGKRFDTRPSCSQARDRQKIKGGFASHPD